MSDDLQGAWDELLEGIAAIKPFPYGNFANRLHNKVRSCFASDSTGETLGPYIDEAPRYPAGDSDPGSYYVDIFLIPDLLDRLSLSTASDGIAGNDEDSEHLKQRVSQDNSKLRYLESLTNLMGFRFLEHINMQLRSQGRRDLDTLYQIDGFKEFCLEQISSPGFANIEIHHDLSAGDHRFSITWLIVADYMDNREYVFRITPSSGSDFASKASYKALSQWSYTLWANGGKNDPDQMDQIVEFCGRVATIGLCPPNATTGLQRPTTVSSVMKSFYNITRKALKDDDYTMDVQRFYRIFQDQNSKMAKLWVSGAKQTQKRIYDWESYLPVIKDPYDEFNQSSTYIILAGTPITLSDGMERLVEDITSKDRILTHGGSRTSVHVGQNPRHKPGKVKLVGFNGEKPFIPSSQVFHTSTGLRAVDPEEAQQLNPHQRIGNLAVGHVVFRLDGGRYQAVGITSIAQTERSIIDRLYNISLPREYQTYHVHGQCINQRLNWELFGKYQSPDGESPSLKGSISFEEHVKVGRTFIKPVGIPIERLARGFFLTAYHPSRLRTGYQLPTLSIIDGYLLVNDEAQLRSTYDPHTRRFRWTRDLKQHGLFEHGVLEIHAETVSGTGVTYLSADSEADTIPSREQVHPFQARARSLEKLLTSQSEDGDTWEPIGKYQVTIDQSVWPPDTDRTEPETPISGGIIEDGTMKSPHGVSTYMIQFPLFDQLRNQISEKFGQNLGPFYQVSGKYRDGLQSFTVAFNKAPLVPFVSDAGLDIDKKFDSEEYNDINRLSSRAAMQSLYEEQLQPYLDDNPDQWAEDLCDQLLGDKHQMLIFINDPVPDGNNVVNKQCNILDVLSPSTDRSKAYFKGFMDFALDQGAQAADIEGVDQDQQYQWIHDSMGELIVAILEGADWISADVRESLMEDINEFEEQNGLNHQLDAQQRAAAILEMTAIFTRELAGWMSSIGKGLQAAFGGTAMFKWAGEAFDTIAAKYASKIPSINKLKGYYSLCMAGVSLVTAAVSIWGLVKNWDSMSVPGRATVIIQTVRMVVDAAGQALDAFKHFKSKPASSPADEINIQALNDSLSDVITENNEKTSEIAQTIAGDEDFRTAMGEGLHGEGLTTDSEPKESWNEELKDVGENVPPGYEDAAKKFNIAGNVLKALNIILGIGLVVAMSFSLANDWNSMTDTGKVLGVLNIVVQGLTVLLDIIDLGEAVGLFAVTGTMSAALPILGAVLAVIGIVLMIVQFFISIFVGRQEPPDPIQDFINDVGHDLISTFDKAPEPQLSYSLSKLQVQGGVVTSLQIEGVNNSSTEVTLSHATITLYSGDDAVCLFANGDDTIELVAETDQNHDKPGHTYVTPSDLSAGQLPYPAKLVSKVVDHI
ncbi:hypothetical protein GQX73_g10942 [Xylaria multiplex]|uniref:Uncharacterized protein n=1 Tax=Xylaria multiplex TaxID=323545 RepID=A0A7C8MJ15_9PEZI|nr:hypothetical protein GQX73_g10942 [Xylaria multiplex]